MRRRERERRGADALEIVDMPPDVLVHILVLLPSLQDVCTMDRVCRLFAVGTPSFGRHSLVEAALRIRHFAHTGIAVPGALVREPWWPWGSTKAKLVHDERCRLGAQLVPLVPDTVVNSDIDVRKGIVFYRRAVGCVTMHHAHALPLHSPTPPALPRRSPLTPAPSPRVAAHLHSPGQPPPDMLLGRMTRAVDNGQGIQDPRVSRQHLKIALAQGEAYEPNGVCRVQALGHNPSTIRRGKLASLGVGFHQEPPSFKLRRTCCARTPRTCCARQPCARKRARRPAPPLDRRDARKGCSHAMPPVPRRPCLSTPRTCPAPRASPDSHRSPMPCASPLPARLPAGPRAGGDVATLYPGDIIQLVCEDVSRAHGRSLPFEGNACSYLIDFLPERTPQLPPGTVVLGREVEETDGEASSAEESAGEGAASPPDASQLPA